VHQRWKYSVVAPQKNGWSDSGSDHYVEEYLYDLQADPHELTNLIGLASHQEVSTVLRQRLLRRMQDAGRRWLRSSWRRYVPAGSAG
jgi:hypothetical protein